MGGAQRVNAGTGLFAAAVHPRGLDARRIAAALRGRVIVDLRNIFDAAALIEAGFDYVGIGRRPMGDKTGS